MFRHVTENQNPFRKRRIRNPSIKEAALAIRQSRIEHVSTGQETPIETKGNGCAADHIVYIVMKCIFVLQYSLVCRFER